MKENPFNIKERKCKKSDYRFYRDLIVKTMKSLVEQYEEFNMEHVKDGFTKSSHEMRILKQGWRRIGFYQLRSHGTTLEITRIYLVPRMHGKGIGSWLMQHFETLAQEKGYKKIILEVWDNDPALNLYKKLGYKVKKKVKHKIHMEKVLKKK